MLFRSAKPITSTFTSGAAASGTTSTSARVSSPAAAGTSTTARQIGELRALLNEGILTQAEFDAAKAKLLK